VLAAGLLRLLGRTWRIEWLGTAARPAPLAPGERCIFALWHARLLPLVYTHRGRGVGVLISHHRDGEWIARIIRRMGYVSARGSSTRGGEEGLREMLGLASAGRILAITPDGPRGPAETAKLGAVFLASRAGLPMIPVAAAGRSEWALRSWDRFRVPKPFARVVVAYGDPIVVPPGLDPAALETWRGRLDAAIREATERADRAVGATAS
jgi:lysophospholipid acyltransferase (LPLAT)-like uncharacterized protein